MNKTFALVTALISSAAYADINVHLAITINNEAVEKNIVVTENAQRFSYSNETGTFAMDISGSETEEGALLECALYHQDDNGDVTIDDAQFSKVAEPVIVAAWNEPATLALGDDSESLSLTLTASK